MLPVQCRMARAALGLSVKKLAVAARVAPQTIVRFERGEKIRPSTVTSLRQVLEAAGVEFTDGRKPGVRCWCTDAATMNAWKVSNSESDASAALSQHCFVPAFANLRCCPFGYFARLTFGGSIND